jgi:hypothetical protein
MDKVMACTTRSVGQTGQVLRMKILEQEAVHTSLLEGGQPQSIPRKTFSSACT